MSNPWGASDFYLYRDQPWAIQNAIDRHVEAIHAFGEPVLFTMLWRTPDFDAGRVGRCVTCYGSSRAAEAFNQSTRTKCPDCFGTTFEGGYRAQIVRPALVDDRAEELDDAQRGTITRNTVLLETFGDFTVHEGDFMFRLDGTRFQCEEKSEDVLRDGFGMPVASNSFTGTIPAAHQEDPTSQAFLVPPVLLADLKTRLLDPPQKHLIPTWSDFDDFRPNGYLSL